jgi:hypothetical protein
MSDRAKLDAIQALAQSAGGSYGFGGDWYPGAIGSAEVCAILGVDPPQPPPPPTDEEVAWIRANLAEIRAARASSVSSAVAPVPPAPQRPNTA